MGGSRRVDPIYWPLWRGEEMTMTLSCWNAADKWERNTRIPRKLALWSFQQGLTAQEWEQREGGR
jgi:hypothetical protein